MKVAGDIFICEACGAAMLIDDMAVEAYCKACFEALTKDDPPEDDDETSE